MRSFKLGLLLAYLPSFYVLTNMAISPPGELLVIRCMLCALCRTFI